MADPYAVRARTHRSDGFLRPGRGGRLVARCKRCDEYWPCPDAGKVDSEPRYRWALLTGALAALAALAIVCGTWLLGWWSWWR